MTDFLSVERDEAILRLRLTRPEKRNALNDEMLDGLLDALTDAARDDGLRAILLSAEGDHFCGGADLLARNQPKDERPRTGSVQRRVANQSHRLIPTLLSVQLPVVAAVRGWTVGIGLHLALAADFAVVADDARLVEPFVDRGFTPDSGASWLLPRLIGMARAKEMLLLGKEISGTRAAEWGMVHRAVPADGVDAAAQELAEALATGPTVALGLTKWLLHAGSGLPLDQHLANEGLALELSARSPDFREGITAMREKRPPSFEGR